MLTWNNPSFTMIGFSPIVLMICRLKTKVLKRNLLKLITALLSMDYLFYHFLYLLSILSIDEGHFKIITFLDWISNNYSFLSITFQWWAAKFDPVVTEYLFETLLHCITFSCLSIFIFLIFRIKANFTQIRIMMLVLILKKLVNSIT